MKQIPPAIQESDRYLKFKIRGEKKEFSEVVEAVWKSATRYMGSKGASEANIWIMRDQYDEESQKGVIRVKRHRVNDFRAAMTIDSGFEDDSIMTVENVSGSLTS